MMTIFSKLFSRRAALGLGALMVVFSAQPAAADDAAEAFVQGILDEATPILTTSDRAALYAGLEQLVDKYVDMRRIGRFVLGRSARQMTDAQAEVYYPLFKRYATQIYQKTLTDYAGQRIVVTGSVDRSERDIIVNSKLADPEPGDQFANAVIHWRVYREADGSMSVVDAGANDIWLAIEQLSQFTSIIKNNGGGEQGIQALIDELKIRVN